MAIIISGSLVYDHIMNFPDSFRNHILPDQLHILNVSFMIDTLQKGWGGTAGNIAYTFKLLGGEPLIVSTTGQDAREYAEHFLKHSISTEFITQDNTQPTASAYITTDQDDNQITAFYGGPLANTPDLPLSAITHGTSLALISPTDKKVMIKHLEQAHEQGLPTVFDPGQQITAFSGEELRHLLSQTSILIGNDYEMELIRNRTGYSATKILEHVPCTITTLGEEGSLVITKEGKTVRVPACQVSEVVDPTGAGDAFRAGFFFGYERKMPLKVCAQIGSVAASFVIEVYGTQNHHFTLEQFLERYQETYGENLALYE